MDVHGYAAARHTPTIKGILISHGKDLDVETAIFLVKTIQFTARGRACM
ncbi:hypothetical protein MY1884_004274 [Beauveria asiatica]